MPLGDHPIGDAFAVVAGICAAAQQPGAGMRALLSRNGQCAAWTAPFALQEQDNRLNQVEIYTDGACKGNPGPGGWGVLLRSGATEKELFGGELGTTNNRMELLAVIEALAALKRPCAVTLYLDSEYVRKGITEWIHGWKARGWRTAAKQPVKNVELWQRLDALVSSGGHRIDWRWVKGHSGDPGNERADLLANKGVEKALGRM